MNMRRKNNLQKWLRDYMVPIIGGILFIVLLFTIFSWGNEPSKVDTENKIWLEVVLSWTNSESYIVYPGDYKKKIEWWISLYKWEEVIVKEWKLKLSLASLWTLNLDKLWELKYLENWDFSLLSSDLWLNSVSAINVNMKFANVKVGENSHISFSQNEMGSTIYLLSWFAEVVNLAWKTTVLWAGQKITISRLDANNKEVDLSVNKENIDDYYKQSDWFIVNNWASFLVSETDKDKTLSWTIIDEKSATGSVSTGAISTNSTTSNLIIFSNLSDESNVSSSSISISWTYFDEEITSITVNWVQAKLNAEMKTFKFENISVPQKENNLVFKVMDDANDVLSKFVYTIYYEWWQTEANTSTDTSTKTPATWWWFKVQTYDVDWSQFTFTEPTTKDTFTTYDDFVTIRWNVYAEWITKVTVNDFALSSFKGGTWRYHAATTNNNLSVWTNIYEIKYYDANNKVVYTNYFTIILKK